MKVYESRPVKHAVIVRPEKDTQDYEVWVLEPKLIGTMERLGTQRVVVDGAQHLHFTNLSTALSYLCDREGVEGLDVPLRGPHIKKVTSVRGVPADDTHMAPIFNPETRKPRAKVRGSELNEMSPEAFTRAVQALPEFKDKLTVEGVLAALDLTFDLDERTLKSYGVPPKQLDKLFSPAPVHSRLSESLQEHAARMISDYNDAVTRGEATKFKIKYDNFHRTVDMLKNLLLKMWETPAPQHPSLVHDLRKTSGSDMTRELEQVLNQAMVEVFGRKQNRS